jgi:hypothetical protein
MKKKIKHIIHGKMLLSKRFLKKDLSILLEKRGIQINPKSKKSILEDSLRDYEIKQMQNCIDSKDPISLEEFHEWTLQQLLERVFLNGYYYQPNSIKNYIESFSGNVVTDPIFSQKEIPLEIISKLQITQPKKCLSREDFQISVQQSSIIFNYFTCPFYRILLEFSPTLKFSTDLKKVKDSTYIIGCIPNIISLNPSTESFYVAQALDISTTSQALLIRIMNLYENQTMMSLKKDTVHISKINALPFRCSQWFSYQDGFPYIDTQCIFDTSKNTIYNSVIKEIYNLE